MNKILSTLIIICSLNASAQLLGTIDPWNQNIFDGKPGSGIQLNNGNILFTIGFNTNIIYNVYAGGGFYPPQTPQVPNVVPVILKHMDDDRYFAVNFHSQFFFNFNHWDTIHICRFLPDGTYDSTFNNNGIYPLPIYNDAPAMYFSLYPYDLVILKDSSIILTYAEVDSLTFSPQVKALKLTSNGIPDNTFGTNGIIVLPLKYREKPDMGALGGIYVVNIPILEDNDHHIYFGGVNNNFIDCLIRYNDAGIFDNVYGFNTDTGVISRLVLDYSGDILAMGTKYNGGIPAEWFVRKYKPNGTLNTGFGINGESVTPGRYLHDGFLQPDGKIVLFGQKQGGNIYGKRLNTNGTIDNTWIKDDAYGQCGNNSQSNFIYTSLMQVPGELVYAVGFSNICTSSALHVRRELLNPCGNGNLISALPVLTASDLNLCQGVITNDTIFISGNLNAASYWEYYTNFNATPQQIYGNNLVVTPSVTTTYYIRGAGYCSGNGPVDSITINVYPNTVSTTNTSICFNQVPYLWNGLNIDSPGTYNATLINANGCDSIATLVLNISLCGQCQPSFTVNWTPFTDSLVESQTWIATSGTVLIPLGAKVKYDANAGGYVSLNPGFKAEYGAVFVAQAYNGCTAGAPQLPQLGKIMPDLQASNEIVLYPNPTTGIIHIKHDEKLNGIQIFDMVGKLIISQKCEGEIETNIDLSSLPNGVYHVKAAGYNSIKVVKNN